MAQSLSPEQLEEGLLNVRRAYRLLHEFHGLVHDIVRSAESFFNLKLRSGEYLYTDINGIKNPLSWSTWDLLPGYVYRYTSNEIDFTDKVGASTKGKNIRLSILLISDTGFYEGEATDKRSITEYAPAEHSATNLVFLLRNDSSPWMGKNDAYLLTLGDEPSPKEPNGPLPLAQKFNLARFLNEESATACFQEFVEFCKNSGYPLL